MAKEIRMKAQRRAEQGSAAARRLRRRGVLPAVVKRLSGASEAIALDAHAFANTMRHHAGDSVLVTLEIDGDAVPALLRELQHNVLDDSALHADFGEISLTEKVRVTIQIKLLGEPEGVRNAGGILEQTLRQVEVECLPTDLIEVLEVDVTELKLGMALTVGDLKFGDAYTVHTNPAQPVATVVAPAAEEEAAAPGTTGEAAQPEVIVKGKVETAEGAGEKKGGDKK